MDISNIIGQIQDHFDGSKIDVKSYINVLTNGLDFYILLYAA